MREAIAAERMGDLLGLCEERNKNGRVIQCVKVTKIMTGGKVGNQ